MLPLPAIALAAVTLTNANSIEQQYGSRTHERLTGTNCNTTASVVKDFPPGSTAVRVLTPRVGDRDEGGGTRVTAVDIAGTKVTITVLADGPTICDPGQTGVPAGEPVNWQADYTVETRYRRRVQTLLRVYYESYLFGAKWALRPRTIYDSRKGAPPGMRVTGIKWRRFGGKTATGTGTMRLDYCRRGELCPHNGARIKLTATTARYCDNSGKVEYRNLKGKVGKLEYFAARIGCG